jgi:AcrR family transcriptional regulator
MSMHRGPGQRAGLTRDAVVAAAVELVARDGVAGLSMRRLAGALGVLPNALYSHVPDKAALIDAVLDAELEQVEVPDLEQVDWRDGLAQIMGSTRMVLLANPDLIPYYLDRPGRGEQARRLGEATLTLLERGGVSGPAAVSALRVLLAYTLGFAAFERGRAAEPDPSGREAAARLAFSSDPDLPRIQAHAQELARLLDPGEFERGLGWLTAGIRASAGSG